MPSTFGGFDIATRALHTSQRTLQVIGHNIANLNTPGYSRQTVEIHATNPLEAAGLARITPGQVGTGVTLAAINRVRNLYVDERLLEERSVQGEVNQARDLLQQIQAAYSEPGPGGISSLLTQFFNRLQDLSTNPERIDVRATVREQGAALARQFNVVTDALGSIVSGIDQQIRSTVDQANKLGRQVAELNARIRQAVVIGDHPNDLLDERDELVRQLSDQLGVRTVEELDDAGRPTGSLNVFVGGFALVLGGYSETLPATHEVIGDVPHLTAGATNYPVLGGNLAGMIKAAELAASYIADLDMIAMTFMNAVNETHRAGYGLDGANDRPFFAGTGARDLRISAEIASDLRAIAAAAPPAPGQTPAAGNGDNARALADLRNAPLFGDYSVAEFYGARVAQVGVDAQSYERKAANQEKVLQQLREMRNAASGVSLDEELAQMLQFQRSYQAAARLLDTMDAVLEDLFSIVGR